MKFLCLILGCRLTQSRDMLDTFNGQKYQLSVCERCGATYQSEKDHE